MTPQVPTGRSQKVEMIHPAPSSIIHRSFFVEQQTLNTQERDRKKGPHPRSPILGTHRAVTFRVFRATNNADYVLKKFFLGGEKTGKAKRKKGSVF